MGVAEPHHNTTHLFHLSNEVLSQVASWLPSECLIFLIETNSRLLLSKLLSPGTVRSIKIVKRLGDGDLTEQYRLLRMCAHIAAIEINGLSFINSGPAYPRPYILADLSLLYSISAARNLTSLTLMARLEDQKGSFKSLEALGDLFPRLSALVLHVGHTNNIEWIHKLFRKWPQDLESLTLSWTSTDSAIRFESLPPTLTHLGTVFALGEPLLTPQWNAAVKKTLPGIVSLAIETALHGCFSLLPMLPSTSESKMDISEEDNLDQLETLSWGSSVVPAGLAMPKGLKSLRAFGEGQSFNVTIPISLFNTIPPGLTSLAVLSVLEDSETSFFNNLNHMPCLTDLHFSPAPKAMNLRLMPPNLRKLVIEGKCFGSTSPLYSKDAQAERCFALPDTLTYLRVGDPFVRPKDILFLPKSLLRLHMPIENQWTDIDVHQLAEHLQNTYIHLDGAVTITQSPPEGTTDYPALDSAVDSMRKKIRSDRVTCAGFTFPGPAQLSLPSSITRLSVDCVRRPLSYPFPILESSALYFMEQVKMLPNLVTLDACRMSGSGVFFDLDVLVPLKNLKSLNLIGTNINARSFSLKKLPRSLEEFICQDLPTPDDTGFGSGSFAAPQSSFRFPSPSPNESSSFLFFSPPLSTAPVFSSTKTGGFSGGAATVSPALAPSSITQNSRKSLWNLFDLPPGLKVFECHSELHILNTPIEAWPKTLTRLDIRTVGWKESDLYNLKKHLSPDCKVSMQGRVTTDGSSIPDTLQGEVNLSKLSLTMNILFEPWKLTRWALEQNGRLRLPEGVTSFMPQDPTRYHDWNLKWTHQLPLRWPSTLTKLDLTECMRLDLKEDYNLPLSLTNLAIEVEGLNVPNTFQYLPQSLLYLSLEGVQRAELSSEQLETLPRGLLRLNSTAIHFTPSSIKALPRTLRYLKIPSERDWHDYDMRTLMEHLRDAVEIRVMRIIYTAHFLRNDITDLNSEEMDSSKWVLEGRETPGPINVSFMIFSQRAPMRLGDSILSIKITKSSIEDFSCFSRFPANLLVLNVCIGGPFSNDFIRERLPTTLTSLTLKFTHLNLLDAESFSLLPRGLRSLTLRENNPYFLPQNQVVLPPLGGLPPQLEIFGLHCNRIYNVSDFDEMPQSVKAIEIARTAQLDQALLLARPGLLIKDITED